MSEKKSLDSNLIKNVLNYWYSFDFLGQSALQTELSRQEKESLEYALNNEGQRQIHSITCRDPLSDGENVQSKITALLSERHMNCTGNIIVFLGSISRNYCTEQIIRAVGAEEQYDASLSKIALASVQIGPSGEFIPNSFSLSPVLWSLNRILGADANKLTHGWLSKEEYDKENLSLEKTISEMGMSNYEDFRAITRYIVQEYFLSIGMIQEGSELSEEINLNYRMYKNEDEREKREGDYYGLTMDFYADDLAMVLSQVDDLSKKGSVSRMQHAVLSYIQAAFDMQKDFDIQRHDLTGESQIVSKEKQFEELKEILDIRRAPLGKWPSRYMPFFMQQVAINLAIDESHEKGTSFEDIGSIFSINGPPGTGKTTLIKEIIANNIVERAKLMAKYVKDPDDIFESCDFKCGPDPKTHAYAKYNTHYYRIKPGFQPLTRYAVVVASNNNAAVDNITVEIPNLKSIQDNLQTKDSDSEDLKQALEEVLRLFDPENGKTEVRRVTTDFETRAFEWQKYNDLYFSSYADNLFSDDRKAWGLISVPLGKKSNLNRFYKKVLSEMTFGPFYKSKKENRGLRPDERKKSYTEAVSAFLTQLKEVERLRDEIVARVDKLSDETIEQYCGQGIDRFRVFSTDYYKDLHSPDTENSIEAHLNNPWFTERYNREREKLFYYAMLLNKEFVLASSCCRNNLAHLGMAWHVEVRPGQYYGDETIHFAKEDLEACMTPLLQSLQLMVPVISTTFASVGNFFRYAKQPGSIGTLIIDEAGQAAPQTAIGALWRAHRAIVIGDPKQIEPVVTDDVSLLKNAYGEDVYRCYAEKTLSVQMFADYLNCYGTQMIDSEEDEDGQWIGSPLTVHRRCISPMYEISNHLSYSDTMKLATPEPSPEVVATLSVIQTAWINIDGKENGRNDHFVVEQGDRVLSLLDDAFKVFFENHPEITENNLDDISEEEDSVGDVIENGPDLFIISPFNTVIEGMKQHLINNLTNPAYPTLSTHPVEVEDWLTDWRNVHVGTVHKFQGREANEVIFLLGCDMGSVRSANWVKKNIVNVAVTRAKYRLVVIGDENVWSGCDPMMVAKQMIDLDL